MPEGWTLPALSATNREWFTTATLAVQTCGSCGTRQHPPEEVCHVCGGMSFSTTVVPGAGTVHSYTVVHHSIHPTLDAVVPYTVVLVRLDAAPDLRVIGNLLGAGGGAGDEVRIGMPVEAVWVERTGEDGTRVLLPQWQRARPPEYSKPDSTNATEASR
jgi:uncharacterized OB-fold protein